MLRARLAARPPHGSWAEHFRSVAETLLCATTLTIAGVPHRLCEIEFYLDTRGHRDPFTHRSEGQHGAGYWYFHRAGSSYRGGSYKGLDISFGPADSHGGVLIRSLVDPDGAIVNGCSLCVDHMLALTGSASVAALDEAIAERPVDDPRGPLVLVVGGSVDRTVWATPRVGLTLKRRAAHPSMPGFIARPYRFLTEPRAIKKGRVQLIVALHRAGLEPDEIQRRCGSPRASIQRYITAYEAGRGAKPSQVVGDKLDARGLCRLYGALSD